MRPPTFNEALKGLALSDFFVKYYENGERKKDEPVDGKKYIVKIHLSKMWNSGVNGVRYKSFNTIFCAEEYLYKEIQKIYDTDDVFVINWAISQESSEDKVTK